MAKLTKEDWQGLREVPILSYLDANGIEYQKDSSNRYRLVEHDSCTINANRNQFYWNSRDVKGDLGNFIQEYEGLTAGQAITKWTSFAREYGTLSEDTKSKYTPTNEPAVKFDWEKLPKSNDIETMTNYLVNERHLDAALVKQLHASGFLAQGRSFKDRESGQRMSAPVLFPWRNIVTNEVVGAERQGTDIDFDKFGKRGTQKRVQAGSAELGGYSISTGNGADKLVVFEAPIDLLSYAQMNYDSLQHENVTLLALSGTNYKKINPFMAQMFNKNKTVPSEIVIAADNDLAGEQLANQYNNDLQFEKIKFSRIIPVVGKDWNDQLKQGVSGKTAVSWAESERRLSAFKEKKNDSMLSQQQSSVLSQDETDERSRNIDEAVRIVKMTHAEFKTLQEAKQELIKNDVSLDHKAVALTGLHFSGDSGRQIEKWIYRDTDKSQNLVEKNEQLQRERLVFNFLDKNIEPPIQQAEPKQVDDVQKTPKTTKQSSKRMSRQERAAATRKANQEIITKAVANVANYKNDPKQVEEFLNFVAANGNSYSARNALLMNGQRPGNTVVKGYEQFKAAGIQVNKGEKGMKIIGAPTKSTMILVDDERIPMSKATPEQKSLVKQGVLPTKETMHYPIVTVFDISQTDAYAPENAHKLPELMPNKPVDFSTNLTNEQVTATYNALKDYAKSQRVSVSENDTQLNEHGPANGVYYPATNSILVRSTLPETHKAQVLAHEIGHASLHNTATKLELTRPQEELQAELTSLVVMKNLGIDTSKHAERYISDWTEGMKNIDDPKGELLAQVTTASLNVTRHVQESLQQKLGADFKAELNAPRAEHAQVSQTNTLKEETKTTQGRGR